MSKSIYSCSSSCSSGSEKSQAKLGRLNYIEVVVSEDDVELIDGCPVLSSFARSPAELFIELAIVKCAMWFMEKDQVERW